MRLAVKPGDDLLARYANQLGALGEVDGHRAMARAVNRTTDATYSRVVRAVSQQSSIKQALVRGSSRKVKAKPGGMGAIEGEIRAWGEPIPLREFNAKQFSYGVKARVYGKQTRFPGMFIFAGTPRSGVFAGGGHVFENTREKNVKSGRNNKIERQDGPAVPTEMVRGTAKDEYERTVADMLPARLAHEIGRLLPG